MTYSDLISVNSQIEFVKFWYENVDKKLIRCSKEFDFFPQLKYMLKPKRKFDSRTSVLIKKYTLIIDILYPDKYLKLSFGNRKYAIFTILNNKRLLSFYMVCYILNRCNIATKTKNFALQYMFEEILKPYVLKMSILDSFYRFFNNIK